MNKRKILFNFTHTELKQISKAIHVYFNLASTKRIYNLIFQVDSIDIALHLLMCHKRSGETLDSIVYQFLYCKDNQ